MKIVSFQPIQNSYHFYETAKKISTCPCFSLCSVNNSQSRRSPPCLQCPFSHTMSYHKALHEESQTTPRTRVVWTMGVHILCIASFCNQTVWNRRKVFLIRDQWQDVTYCPLGCPINASTHLQAFAPSLLLLADMTQMRYSRMSFRTLWKDPSTDSTPSTHTFATSESSWMRSRF